MHPTVSDPFTTLNQVPSSHCHHSVLDVKDAFWGCPLTQDAKLCFALEWEQEVEGKMVKTWTLLLQGCTEAPALLGQALQKISQEFTPPQGLGSCRMWMTCSDQVERKW